MRLIYRLLMSTNETLACRAIYEMADEEKMTHFLENIQGASQDYNYVIADSLVENPIGSCICQECLTTIPCRPPFEATWVEGRGPDCEGVVGDYGALFLDHPDETNPVTFVFLFCDVQVTQNTSRCGFIEAIALHHGENGTCRGWTYLDADVLGLRATKIERDRELYDSTWPVVRFALDFLVAVNAKNIGVEDVVKPRTRKTKRKKLNNQGVKFKTLIIKPGKTKTEDEDRPTTETNLPLHVCRGHFKTYTKEKPLFGSYSGTFFWRAFSRGKDKHGRIEKNYRVEDPRGKGGD